MFFNLYFMMTGLHGIHVIIGMIVMIVVYNRLQSGTLTHENQGILEYTGLYWHLGGSHLGLPAAPCST